MPSLMLIIDTMRSPLYKTNVGFTQGTECQGMGYVTLGELCHRNSLVQSFIRVILVQCNFQKPNFQVEHISAFAPVTNVKKIR